MAKIGRPRKLDEVKKREICALLSAGGTRAQAARYVGCSIATIVNAGRRDAKFRDEMRKAEASFEVVLLRNMQQAATRSWRANAWALERRFPDLYSRRHPDTFTEDQMKLVLNELAQALMEVITSRADRDRLYARLDEIGNQTRSELEAARDPLLAEGTGRRIGTAMRNLCPDPAPEVHDLRKSQACPANAAAT